VKFDISDKFI